MGLLTTMKAYFMIELRTILRYIFLRCMSDNLPLQINICSCHQETNGDDCGIYAVANDFIFQVELTQIDKNGIRASVFRASGFEPFPTVSL